MEPIFVSEKFIQLIKTISQICKEKDIELAEITSLEDLHKNIG